MTGRRRDRTQPQRQDTPAGGDAAWQAIPSTMPFYLAAAAVAYISLLALGDWWAAAGAVFLPGVATAHASPRITRRQAASIGGRIGGVYGFLRGVAVTCQYLVLGGRQAYSVSSGTSLPPLDVLTVVGTVLAQLTLFAASIVVAAAISVLVCTVLSQRSKGARRG